MRATALCRMSARTIRVEWWATRSDWVFEPGSKSRSHRPTRQSRRVPARNDLEPPKDRSALPRTTAKMGGRQGNRTSGRAATRCECAIASLLRSASARDGTAEDARSVASRPLHSTHGQNANGPTRPERARLLRTTAGKAGDERRCRDKPFASKQFKLPGRKTSSSRDSLRH